jgi:predicted transcriptional regulator
MSNDILERFNGDQALSPHEAEQKTPLNKPLTESNEIRISQNINRENANSNFQKRMSGTVCIDQLNRTIESNFTELQQQLTDKMCKISVEIHKKLKDESRKIVKENKDQQQQMWEKLQKVKEELQQFKEQHKHLIEPDPMSTVVKVS